MRQNYLSNLKRNAFPKIGNMKMAKIMPVHIQSILTDMYEKGRAQSTIKYAFACINSVMSYAYRMKVIDEDPCDRCEIPKVKAKQEDLHYFTPEQAATFLHILGQTYEIIHHGHTRKLKRTNKTYYVPDYVEERQIGLQFQVYFYLAIYGAFRRGELLALTW